MYQILAYDIKCHVLAAHFTLLIIAATVQQQLLLLLVS